MLLTTGDHKNYAFKMPGGHMFSRHIFYYGVLLPVIGILALVFTLPVFTMFVVVEQKTGKILYHSDIAPGDTFKVTYTHSVNKSPVEDLFEIQTDHSIMVKKSTFRSFGAGIPFEPGEGQSFKVYDDRIELDNINLKLKQYLLFVGLIANHTLWIKEQEIRLDHLTKPQQTVKFEVRKISLYHRIRGTRNVTQ